MKLDLENSNHIKSIIIGCESGDKRVQNQFFDIVYKKMFIVALSYSSGREEAEDIMSDAFIKIFENINKVKVGEGSFEGWIRRIVVNTAIDYIRKNRKSKRLTYSIDDEDFEFSNLFSKLSIKENFSERMDGKYLLEMIQDLSPGYKAVFNLVVIEGCSHNQVSKKLGIHFGTSKSTLSKAKKILRKKIEKFNEEELSYV